MDSLIDKAIWEGGIVGGAVLLYDWSKSPLGNMDFMYWAEGGVG